jgi:threonine dehydratase
MRPFTFDDIIASAERIAPEAGETPVLTSSPLDARVGAHVLCKSEALQRGGAFKFRGVQPFLTTLRCAWSR